jgi:formamidopyrimidine-DNA glycosylase
LKLYWLAKKRKDVQNSAVMPEMPEVEVVRRQLEAHILNREIESVDLLHSKITRKNPEFKEFMVGKHFSKIERIGKLLTFTVSNNQTSQPEPVYMLAHLKMTGQFIFVDENQKIGGGHSLTAADFELPHKHTRVVFNFKDGSALYFNDMRLFGYLQLVSPAEKEKIWNNYGIEPGRDNYTWDNFKAIFKNRKTSLKALLLNQKVISGLGNIYVDEACFRAGVLPFRAANSLTTAEKKALFKHCSDVMMESIERGGTTFYSFLSADGKKGNFSDELEVFDRAGQPCYKCGNIISKIKHAGRGTHFCSTCQK